MRAAIFKGLRLSGLPFFLRRQKKDAITTLCFHRITNETDLVWKPMKVSVFERILRYCKKNYALITPEQIKEKTSLPKMIITFDDGYYDFMENALPLLMKYAVPCLNHVVVDSMYYNRPNWTYLLNVIVDDYLKSRKLLEINWKGIHYKSQITQQNASRESLHLFHQLKNFPLDESVELIDELIASATGDLYFPRMMDTEDLRICEKNGVAIGSHGMSHVILTGNCTEEILDEELKQSKEMLEKELGHPVTSFSFPAGSYDGKVLETAAKAGYNFLFSTHEKLFFNDTQESPFLFPRLLMPPAPADEAILYLEMFHRRLR